MAENSKIEWTHHTFNPWIGCTKVGPGCDNCYAEAWDKRGLQAAPLRWGPHAARTRTSTANWRKPLAWNKAAAAAGERHRVFCASLADVFDNHASILPEWRADLWALIRATPNLDWMLLTKRPGNIAGMLPRDWGDGYPNVWLGCTVVNQTEADRDIPKLFDARAAVRFVSIEPMLGHINIERWMHDSDCDYDCPDLNGDLCLCRHRNLEADLLGLCDTHEEAIDLVIVGGESGQRARPMHPDWVRSLRDQCVSAGVAFHFKQWGEWADETNVQRKTGRAHHIFTADGDVVGAGAPKLGIGAVDADWRERGAAWMSLVGKARTGRLLDGRTWDEMPDGGGDA